MISCSSTQFHDHVIEEVREIVGRRNAVVLIGEATHLEDQLDSVRSDHAGGARQMMAHLLDLGHRSIGFVFGVAGPPLGQERLLAYQQGLHDAGVMVDASLVEHCGVTLEDGYRAAQRLLDHSPPPTAILVINDLLAIGVVRAISERGLRIPDEISVAGFDDIAMTRYLSPPLTTVRVHADEVGRTAMRLCFERMRDPERPLQSVCVPAELVQRGSTGRVPVVTSPAPISGALPVAASALPVAASALAGAIPMGAIAELLSPAVLPELELQGASKARGDDLEPAQLLQGGPIPSRRARTPNAAVGSPA